MQRTENDESSCKIDVHVVFQKGAAITTITTSRYSTKVSAFYFKKLKLCPIRDTIVPAYYYYINIRVRPKYHSCFFFLIIESIFLSFVIWYNCNYAREEINIKLNERGEQMKSLLKELIGKRFFIIDHCVLIIDH